MSIVSGHTPANQGPMNCNAFPKGVQRKHQALWGSAPESHSPTPQGPAPCPSWQRHPAAGAVGSIMATTLPRHCPLTQTRRSGQEMWLVLSRDLATRAVLAAAGATGHWPCEGSGKGREQCPRGNLMLLSHLWSFSQCWGQGWLQPHVCADQ